MHKQNALEAQNHLLAANQLLDIKNHLRFQNNLTTQAKDQPRAFLRCRAQANNSSHTSASDTLGCIRSPERPSFGTNLTLANTTAQRGTALLRTEGSGMSVFPGAPTLTEGAALDLARCLSWET